MSTKTNELTLITCILTLIVPGDVPPNNAIDGSAEFSAPDSTIDLGRIFMTQGTIAMWIKPNEVPKMLTGWAYSAFP